MENVVDEDVIVEVETYHPTNVLHFSLFFLSLPPICLHQGDVGIPGEQGEIGYKGDKVEHHSDTYACYKCPSSNNTNIQNYTVFVVPSLMT